MPGPESEVPGSAVRGATGADAVFDGAADSATRGAARPEPSTTPTAHAPAALLYDVPHKEGIYIDSTGARCKKTRAGVRYPADAAGSRVFNYAAGLLLDRRSSIPWCGNC